MSFLMLDFFNTVINTLFREVPDYVRYILILVLLALSFFFLAKTLNLKKAEKTPINYGALFLFLVFFVLCMMYIWLQ